MARRTINRMEKRVEYEAYERRQTDDGEDDDDDDDDDDEEEAAEPTDEAAAEEAGDEEDEAPKPKKAKKPPQEPKKPRSRSRAAKVVRVKMVWGVFNNANVRVASYDYPRRGEAEEHAARLSADKKTTHFVQPIKEPIDEKKEA